jgi:mono/diheme cytochrome c family protein
MNVSRNLILAAIITVLVTVVLIVVFVGEKARMEEETKAQQGLLVARGARLYDSYCAGCHGKRGEGLAGIYPPLNVEDMWEGREEIAFYGTLHDYIALNISAGHPSQNMPSWSEEYGGPLRADQIETLTQYVLNWQGPQPEGVRGEVAPTPTKPVAEATPTGPAEAAGEGDPARGQEIFARNCIGCHGAEAAGGPAGPSLVHAEIATQDDDFYRQVITNGRAGTSMPAWGSILNGQDIEDVIQFLRSKQ